MSSMLLKPIRRRSGCEQCAVARAIDVDDRRPGFAQRLPDHAAPAGLEGAVDVVGLVGGRRGLASQKGLGLGCRQNWCAGSAMVCSGFRCSSVGHEWLGRLLAVLHRLHRQVQAAGTAITTGPDAALVGQAIRVGGNAAACISNPASASSGLPKRLTNGLEHHVGFNHQGFTGRHQLADPHLPAKRTPPPTAGPAYWAAFRSVPASGEY
jgi:hypothetical protein